MLFFYPKAMTKGCTIESCGFRDKLDELAKLDTVVIGISTDKLDDQMKFIEKEKLNFPLLADNEKTVAKAFGVPTTLGFAKRQSFLIQDGKCVWNQLSASTDKQAEDVLKAFEALPKK